MYKPTEYAVIRWVGHSRRPRRDPLVVRLVGRAAAFAAGAPFVVALRGQKFVRQVELDGVEIGDEITPELVGRVVAHEEGGLKGVPADATAIPLINAVDDDADEAVARSFARVVHERADVPRVVLARMIAGEVVDVVE